MYTLIPTVYRALLNSAVSGTDHRIHTTKKTTGLPCNMYIRPECESGLSVAYLGLAPSNTANDGPSLTQQFPAQRAAVLCLPAIWLPCGCHHA